MLSTLGVGYLPYRNVSHNEEGRSVARAVGLKILKLLCKLEVYVRHIYLAINLKLYLEGVIVKMLSCIGVYSLSERVKVSSLDCKSRRKLVSAVFYEQILASAERLNEIEPLDASSRALAVVERRLLVAHRAVEGHENRRKSVSLGYLRGYYSYYTLLPLVAVKHDDGIFVKIWQIGYHFVSLLCNSVLFYLSLTVDGAKLLGISVSLLACRGKQSSYRYSGVGYSSRRVYSRGYTKADKARGYLSLLCVSVVALFRRGRLNKRRKSRTGSVLHYLESHADDKSVLVNDRHNVGNSAERGQIGVLRADLSYSLNDSPAALAASSHLTSADELKNNAYSCKLLKRIATIGTVGIYHRASLGKLASALVVVGHHEINAKRSAIFDLCRRGDTRIYRDYQADTVLAKRVDCRAGNAVSLALSLGYLDAYVSTKLAKIQIQHTYRGYAVNVVISVNTNLFVILNSLKYSLDCPVHIL